MKNRLTPVLAGCAAVLLIMLAPSAVGSSSAVAEGSLTSVSFHSTTLGEAIDYNVYLPAGYEASSKNYPVLYLLHGRGDSMSAWVRMQGTLDELIANGDIPPTIAIMPDAPWSSRASYYVDSAYRGADPGRAVETAFTQDLIAHVDSTYRTVASRNGRGVAGYSMGGYGAIRYSLAHPDLFGAAIVLSPAVYIPSGPRDSSTREFGAFGKDKRLFVDHIYQRLNYPETFESFTATGLTLPMYIAVGDDEFKNPEPKDWKHDLDFEAHVLFNQASRVENITAELRVVDGGHDWDVWGPQFVEGAKYVFQFLDQAPATPMKASLVGTAGEERAGGVAVDSAGNVYQALAAEGSIAGQPYSAAKDLVLVKDSPSGTRLWTRELGTARTERAYGVAIDAAGDVVVTGYTTGDLDGGHAGNTTDDVFVVKFDPAGTQKWLRQFGVPSLADRGYAIATDAASNIYVTGYTRGDLAAVNLGDKDIYIAKLDSAGTQLWLKQFGSAGEDKAWGVAATGDGIRLGGMTSGAIGSTPAGALDGWVARYDAAGTQAWLTQFGTTRQRGGLGPDGGRGGQHLRRGLFRRGLRRATGRRQGHRRRPVRPGRDDDLGRPARHRPERQGCGRRARRGRQLLRRRLHRRQHRHEGRRLGRRARQVRRRHEPRVGAAVRDDRGRRRRHLRRGQSLPGHRRELDLRLRAFRRRHGVQRVGGDRRRLSRQVRCARRERVGREWGGVR